MNVLTEITKNKIMLLVIVLAVNTLAALAYGQESDAQLLEDAKATFGIVSDPKQEELDKPIVELGRHLF